MPRKRNPVFPTVWKGGKGETECGAGSMVENMQPVIKWLPQILNMINPQLKPIMELGCGDLNFAASAILPCHNAEYIGVDLQSRDSWVGYMEKYPSLNLAVANICDPDARFSAKVVIVRDVFIHLTNIQVSSILERITADYLICTTYVGANNKSRGNAPHAGFMPIDMSKPPFKLKSGLMIQEHANNKFLGIYEL